ncbi:MAG: hypothetical protein M2R45_01415 [Verrucomicrobia subdivision 3 bacterium]|nr:hypothetical protein [Limisphaerales bacterium]MCS1415970.1 hypothetical protein [Limisphaerales bacterium]
MDSDGAAPVLAQVDDVARCRGSEDVEVEIKIADALAVRKNAGLVLGDAFEGNLVIPFSLLSGCGDGVGTSLLPGAAWPRRRARFLQSRASETNCQMITVSMRDEGEYDGLKRLGAELDLSVAWLIRRVVSEFVARCCDGISPDLPLRHLKSGAGDGRIAGGLHGA